MLDISLGEVLLTFGVGIAVIGRRDLPVFARAAGRQLGRAVTYIRISKDSLGTKLDETVGHSELKKVQAELNKTMRELDAVKREVYSASDISTSAFMKPAKEAAHNTQQSKSTLSTPQAASSENNTNASNIPNTNNIAGGATASNFSNNSNTTERSGSSLLTEIYLDEWEHTQHKNKTEK